MNLLKEHIKKYSRILNKKLNEYAFIYQVNLSFFLIFLCIFVRHFSSNFYLLGMKISLILV